MLTDRRILITRAHHQASTLAALLLAEGATPILIPTIEIAPPPSYAALDHAIAQLPSYDWLLFTSANAVEVFADRNPAALPEPLKLAVIGPATAKAVSARLDRQPNLIPPHYLAESLAETLIPHAQNARMLLVRAAQARDLLPEALTAAGAHITLADAYQTLVPAASTQALATLFADSPPDAILFTSASTAHNLAALLAEAALTLPPETALISIGPITSRALTEHAWTPTAEAAEATLPALIEALRDALRSALRLSL